MGNKRKSIIEKLDKDYFSNDYHSQKTFTQQKNELFGTKTNTVIKKEVKKYLKFVKDILG